jgi:hypothetical protein
MSNPPSGTQGTAWLSRVERWLAVAAEWEAATWLNILTGAAAIIGLIGLIFVGLTLGEAKDSTVWANRAWIAPAGVGQDLQTSGEVAGQIKLGAELPIRIFYDNVGKGPALKVKAYFTPKIVVPVDGNAMGGINNSCEEGSTGSSTPGIVFQNSGKTNWWTLKIPAKYITSELVNGDKDLIIQGCATYTTMNEPHKTLFCYVVFWDKKMSSPNYSPFCGDGQDAD